MTRRATNAVDEVLSGDWHQVLAAVTDQTTADQIWTDNGNPQPDNLRRGLRETN